ncbi:hypothetical protein C8J56DRAFT_1052156 [Mycena floridula]|nr:hypothetical protein C8J56DRAFT_1052156 [Mycena floridula]
MEIWTQIFVLSMTGDSSDLRLPQVCVHLKEILLYMPRLWDKLYIDLERPFSAVHSFLSARKCYGQDTSVAVNIWFPERPPDELPSNWPRNIMPDDGYLQQVTKAKEVLPVLHDFLVEIMADLQFTMKELAFENFCWVWQEIIPSLDYRLPKLTSFKVQEEDLDDGGDFSSVFNLFKVGSSTLRSLSLTQIRETWDPTKIHSSLWEKLQVLTVCESSASVVFDFLGRARNLTSVDFGGLRRPRRQSRRITFSAASKQLTHLYIEDHDIPILFAVISIPSLTHLYVRHIDYDDDWAPDVIPFLEQSQCRLHTLEIEQICISDNALLDILQRTPALRSLTLSVAWATDVAEFNDLCCEMTLSHQNDMSPVPHLQSLAITIPAPSGEMADATLDMMASRLSSNGGHIILSYCALHRGRSFWATPSSYSTIDAMVSQKVERMKREGLSFLVTPTPKSVCWD